MAFVSKWSSTFQMCQFVFNLSVIPGPKKKKKGGGGGGFIFWVNLVILTVGDWELVIYIL
jgi:hypothetical protein